MSAASERPVWVDALTVGRPALPTGAMRPICDRCWMWDRDPAIGRPREPADDATTSDDRGHHPAGGRRRRSRRAPARPRPAFERPVCPRLPPPWSYGRRQRPSRTTVRRRAPWTRRRRWPVGSRCSATPRSGGCLGSTLVLVALGHGQDRPDDHRVQEVGHEPQVEQLGVGGPVVVLLLLDPGVGQVLDGHGSRVLVDDHLGHLGHRERLGELVEDPELARARPGWSRANSTQARVSRMLSMPRVWPPVP